MKQLVQNQSLLTSKLTPCLEEHQFVRIIIYKVLFGLVWAFNLVDSLNFTTMYGQHAVYQIYTLVAFGIGTFEIRYISQRVPAYIDLLFIDPVLHGFTMLILIMNMLK